MNIIKDGEVISGYPDENNHSIDAVRYALERVFMRREFDNDNTTIFKKNRI